MPAADEKRATFDNVAERLCEKFEVSRSELHSGSKRRPVSEVRQLLSYAACRIVGLTGTEVGRLLGVSKQAILKATTKAEESWEDLDWLTELTK